MKKLWIGLLCLSILWIAKLTYDQQQYTQRLDVLERQATKVEQNADNINDQLIAFQRKVQPLTQQADQGQMNLAVPSQAEQHLISDQHMAINPIVLIQQQLDLIQFALQQKQTVYALERLQLLSEKVLNYDFAPALRESVYTSLLQDQQNISQFNLQHSIQVKHAYRTLRSLDQLLNQLMKKNTLSYSPNDDHKHSGFSWFSLQPSSQAKTNLMGQSIVIKEAQLRLIIAKQMIDAGQYSEYRYALDDILALCHQSPMLNKKEVLALIQQANNIPLNDPPKLHTPALLK